MKALKEKRISLRSLWRRGLVILSLFALVFASCSESGGGSSDEGKIVSSVTVRWPANTQYMGTRIDLTGIKATITYKDGEVKVVDDLKRFTTVPKVATGEYDLGTNAFTGLGFIDIYLDGFLCVNTARPDGRWPITTMDIARDDARMLVDDWMVTLPGNVVDRGYYSTGLHVDALDMKTKVVYADDEEFDWTGVRLQALYGDGNGGVAWKEIMPQDVMWYIIPEYTEVTGRPLNPTTRAYAGWVYIYAGADIENDGAGVMDLMGAAGHGTAANSWRYGVSARIPLDTVYTVEKITYTMDVERLSYAFWEANTPKAWEDKLQDQNFELQVDYKGIGWTQKKFDIEALAKAEKVWWNNNPIGVAEDFFVMPLSYPFTTKNKTGGILKLYYRGVWGDGRWNGSGEALTIPVDVYTKLVSIDVRPKGGTGSVGFDADDIPGGYDNDVWDFGKIGTEQQFAALFDVVATYTTYNVNPATNAVTSKEFPLTLKPTLDPVSGVFAPGEANGAWFVTTWHNVRNTIKKDGQSKAVKITHTVSANDVEDTFGNVAVANRQWYTYNLDDPVNALLGPGEVQWLSGTRVGTLVGSGTFDGEFHILNTAGSANPNAQSKKKSLAVTWSKR